MFNSEQIIDKEIRFAVVMYGGVSLAIYINGVAQELLKMVRATSVGNNLSSTEKIYQQISCLLSNEELLGKVAEKSTVQEIEELLKTDLKTENCASTKFVVDIISGTSAGGINGVFLAKALAKNQSIEELKKLWLDEGDISKLINDKKSVADINLKAPVRVKSLLNSRRMFLKLLEAVEGMDKNSENKGTENNGSLVNEIDLFITVTDFQGVSVPLRLLDRVVYERRYRHVFHFQHNFDNERFDFDCEHNPMLAFAARCTSAFPFAFEPMRLSDAMSVIREACDDSQTMIDNLTNDKERFFARIKNKNGQNVDWENRDLVDGGYLDNKPFSYAIDALSRRRADFQVERKLLYVEPSPENLGLTQAGEIAAPDALQNAKAAISEMPRYETIREDLQRVLERNRLIERVNRLIGSAEKDVYTYLSLTEAKNWNIESNVSGQTESSENPKSGVEWEKYGLDSIVRLKGHAVLPYYRLRISGLTDEIARLVTRKVGVEEDSEYFLAIRALVNAWRKKNYVTYLESNPLEGRAENTVMAFLRSYDLDYRLRRLRFVQEKANQLFRFDDEFQSRLDFRQKQLAKIREKQNELESQTGLITKSDKSDKSDKRESVADQQNKQVQQTYVEEKIEVPKDLINKKQTESTPETQNLMPSEIIWKFCGLPKGKKKADEIVKLRLIVNYFQNRLKTIFGYLQKEKEKLYSNRSDSDELLKAVRSVEFSPEILKKLLEITDVELTDEVDESKLSEFLENKYREVYQPINTAANELNKLLEVIFNKTREEIKELLQTELEILPEELEGHEIELDLVRAVRSYLNHFYRNFDDYDQISFPVYYETEVGEAVQVEILRISPLDAKILIDEEDNNETRRKLAGTQFYNFGAFLDRVWRKNDIMWGRLDGAERIITAILPGEKYSKIREFFAGEMNRIILAEELMESDKEELRGILADSLVNASAGFELKDVVSKITGNVTDEAVKNRLAAVLRACFENNQIVDFVRNNFEVDRNTEPKELLRAISRATQVTGGIFEAIADDHGKSGDRMRWISRLGKVFWGLVEVAAPNSIWNKFFDHWLKLFYLFELVLIIGATIFNKADIQQFGIVIFLITLIAHLVVMNLNDYMRGNKFGKFLSFFAVSLLLFLCLFGFLCLFAIFFEPAIWNSLTEIRDFLGEFRLWQRLFPVAVLPLLFAVSVSRDSAPTNLRIVGLVTLIYVFLMIGFSILFAWLTSDAKGIGGLGAILSLEFVGSVKELAEIAGEPGSPARIGLKRALAVDSFLFVPLYAGFLLYFSRLLNLSNGKWVRRAMNIAVFCILGAALADLIENYFSYSVLERNVQEIPNWMILAISTSAKIKFGLIALVTALLSPIFWHRPWRFWNFLTIGLLLTALVGLTGLFQHFLIIWFMSGQILLLLIISGVVSGLNTLSGRRR